MFTPLSETIGELWRPLSRFYPFRLAVALFVSMIATGVLRLLVGSPPTHWPREAAEAARLLVDGAIMLTWAPWLLAFLGLAEWIRRDDLRACTQLAMAGFTLLGLGLGLLDLIQGGRLLSAFPIEAVLHVLEHALWTFLGPLVFGSAPLWWFFFKEWVLLQPMARRLFRTGSGAAGGWLPPQKMRRYLRDLPGVRE
jgi:hypothetical protein